MDYLVDTNVAARSILLSDPSYSLVSQAIAKLMAQGDRVFITAQNLIEFCGFATRPAGPPANGLGMAPAQADAELQKMKAFFRFLSDTPAIYTKWEKLVFALGVAGKQVHDARLVAVMKTYGVTHLLTLNPGDFVRYPGITVIHPQDV
jgi:predicted nucleic acid-binding protein